MMNNETCHSCGNKEAVCMGVSIDFTDDILTVTARYRCPFCGTRWSVSARYFTEPFETIREMDAEEEDS